MPDNDRVPDAQELRRRAESKAKESPEIARDRTSDVDLLRLIHELQVHQIELEMQNEELIRSRAELEQMDRYTDLYDHAPVGYLILGPEGKIEQINLTGARLLGFERSRLVGTRLGLFLAPEERDAFRGFLAQVFAGHNKVAFDVALDENGKDPPAAQERSPARELSAGDLDLFRRRYLRIEATATGDVSACRAVLIDITERKHAEQALVESEARFRAVFEDAAIGIGLVDLRGHLITANHALQQMLGRGLSELEGLNLVSLIRPADDASTLLQDWDDILSGERRLAESDVYYERKNGDHGWGKLALSLVLDATKNRPRFVVCMLEDTTQSKAALAALVQAEKLVVAGKLAGTLTHEVNNPLQSVVGCLGLAREALAEGGDPARYIDVAYAEVLRASRIVSRFRDLYHRTEEERPEPTALNDLVDQILTLVARRAENGGIKLDWRPAPNLPTIHVRRDSLKQVFLNVVVNAMDAMPDGGRITVTTQATTEPRGVLVRMQDTGVGIPADVLERLFQSFYSSKENGLGLGLYVCQSIVAQHSGHITAESQVGRGSTFNVWLPAA